MLLLFATSALLLLIITTYHDYNMTVVTIYVNARYLHFVLQSCREEEEEAKEEEEEEEEEEKDVRTFSWSQSNTTVAYMYTHISATWVRKPRATHACTRAATKIPRRELHYILLDCINSVDARACSRDILHAHVRYVGRTNFMCVGCTVACVRRARDPRARREILWRCNQGGYVFITEYRYY